MAEEGSCALVEKKGVIVSQFSFYPEERISRDREIQRLLTRGQRAVSGDLTLFWIERNKEEVDAIIQKNRERTSTCRFAIRLDKNFPNAVSRNRAKRIFREIFRTEKWRLRAYTDLLLIIHPQEFHYEKMKKEFIALCRQAGIWNGA